MIEVMYSSRLGSASPGGGVEGGVMVFVGLARIWGGESQRITWLVALAR